MLANPVIFVTIPYTQLRTGAVLRGLPGVGINILLDATEIDILLLQNVLTAPYGSYIFSLSGELLGSREMDRFLPKLYTVLSLSDHFCGARCTIPVITQTADDQVPGLASLRDYFVRQGEENIDFLLCPLTSQGQKHILLLRDVAAFEQLHEEQLEVYAGQELRQIIVYAKGALEEDMGRVQRAVDNNRNVKLLLQMTAIQSQRDLHLNQTVLWQQRAKLYLSFVALGKKVGETEYYDIRQWYHDEYEVLPLWYKRVGHVIKAFTGKRSFRSLFIDHIKNKN